MGGWWRTGGSCGLRGRVVRFVFCLGREGLKFGPGVEAQGFGSVTYEESPSVELIRVDAGGSIMSARLLLPLLVGKARVRAIVGHWRRRSKEDQVQNAILGDELVVVRSRWRRSRICHGRCVSFMSHIWRGTYGTESKRQASMRLR